MLSGPESAKSILSNNEIHDNKVDGDLIIGSTVIKFPSFNIGANGEALRNLIEQHIRLQEDDPIYCMVLDELQSRIKDSPSRNVIGLSEKLRIAGRENYIDEALVSSQKASREGANKWIAPSPRTLCPHLKCPSLQKPDFFPQVFGY